MEVSDGARRRLKRLALIEKGLPEGEGGWRGAEAGQVVEEYFVALEAVLGELNEAQIGSLKLIPRSWVLVLRPYIEAAAAQCDPELIALALKIYRKCDEDERCGAVKVHAAIHGRVELYAADARLHLLAGLQRAEGREPRLLEMFLRLCFCRGWFYDALRVGALLLDPAERGRLHGSLGPGDAGDPLDSLVRITLFGDLHCKAILHNLRRHLCQATRLKPVEDIARLLYSLGFALCYRGAHAATIHLYKVFLTALPSSSGLGSVSAFWALLFIKSAQGEEEEGRGVAEVKLATWVLVSGSLNSACWTDEGRGARLALALEGKLSLERQLSYAPAGAECSAVAIGLLRRSPSLWPYLRFDGEAFVLGPRLLSTGVSGVSPQDGNATEPAHRHTGPPPLTEESAIEQMRQEIDRLRLEKDALSQAVAQSKADILSPVYILDTNILIDHLAFLDGLLQRQPVRIAIPSFVLIELDGLIKSPRQGKSAETVAKYLDRVDPAALRGSLHGINAEGRLTRFISHPPGQRDLFPRSAEICSIDEAILYSAKRNGHAVLVSDDLNLRLKAQAMQVQVLPWGPFHQQFRDL